MGTKLRFGYFLMMAGVTIKEDVTDVSYIKKFAWRFVGDIPHPDLPIIINHCSKRCSGKMLSRDALWGGVKCWRPDINELINMQNAHDAGQ